MCKEKGKGKEQRVGGKGKSNLSLQGKRIAGGREGQVWQCNDRGQGSLWQAKGGAGKAKGGTGRAGRHAGQGAM